MHAVPHHDHINILSAYLLHILFSLLFYCSSIYFFLSIHNIHGNVTGEYISMKQDEDKKSSSWTKKFSKVKYKTYALFCFRVIFFVSKNMHDFGCVHFVIKVIQFAFCNLTHIFLSPVRLCLSQFSLLISFYQHSLYNQQ